MTHKQIQLLFLFSLIGILFIYSIFLSTFKIINLITDQHLFIALLFLLWIIGIFFKSKLKNREIIDFHKNGNLTLKTTILFFLFFQVIDYIYEDGFIGMISQWFIYWIMGIIAFKLLTIINYYKNIQLYKKIDALNS